MIRWKKIDKVGCDKPIVSMNIVLYWEKKSIATFLALSLF